MRQLLFTLFFSFIFYSGFAQLAKPLNPPTKEKSETTKIKKPITTSLKGIPSAKRSILNTSFRPQSLAPLKRGLTKSTGLTVVQTSKEGAPIMIKGQLKDVADGRDLSLQVFDYLEAIKTPIQIKAPQEEFVIINRSTDDLGHTHIKLQQRFEGVNIYGGQVILHAQNGQVNLFNGRNYPTPNLENLTPSISKESAENIAKQIISKETSITELSELEQKLMSEARQPELVIYYPESSRQPILAWHLELHPNIMHQYEYFINAKTGALLDGYSTLCQLHHNVNRTKTHEHAPKGVSAQENQFSINNNNLSTAPENGPATTNARDLNNTIQTVNSYEINGDFFLIDASKAMFSSSRSKLPNEPVGAVWTIDANGQSPENSNFDASHVVSGANSWNEGLPVSAHSNAGIVYDYYRNTFSRNSFNNQGGTIISVINVSDKDGSNLENAFWTGTAMFYGNGGNEFAPLAKSLDVAAHEMSHGVVSTTANLRYQGESGAMNESFADVFAVLVDRDDYRLGEDVVNPNIFRSGALRDLANPHNGGNRLGDAGWQPDNVSEQYRGNQDNGGVHINSGIVNKAFHLISSNIGREKAEKIYYRALTEYLVNSSQFVDLRASIIQSSEDWHGVGSNEAVIAGQAFDAVGIIGASTGSGSSSGGLEEEVIEVGINPGEDFVLYTDANNSTIYIADGTGKKQGVISNSGILSKPSITDDGTAVAFIAADKTMHLIVLDWETGAAPEEFVIQDEPIWRNVAVSRDGFRIAALLDERRSEIEVYDFTIEEFKTYQLYNPTYTEGINTGEVNYADVIEFDFTGEFVMYDAENTIKGNFGGNDITYYDIGFIKVYDNTIDFYEQDETNNITKLFTGLPENLSIGNPTFAKNSPNVIAYEYIDEFDKTEEDEQIYELRGLNLSTRDEETVFRNLTLNVPNYSRLDDKIIFNFINGDKPIIAEIEMAENKIAAKTGEAFIFIDEAEGARLGVWFSDGSRQLTSTNELEKSLLDLQVAPNPFTDELRVQFSLEERKSLNIEIFNMLGQRLLLEKVEALSGNNQYQLDTSELPNGAYLVSLTSEEGIVSIKVVK